MWHAWEGQILIQAENQLFKCSYFSYSRVIKMFLKETSVNTRKEGFSLSLQGKVRKMKKLCNADSETGSTSFEQTEQFISVLKFLH